MIERALIWAITGIGCITAGLFVLVFSRELRRVISAAYSGRRERQCRKALMALEDFSDESLAGIRRKFRVVDIEWALKGIGNLRGMMRETEIELFERLNVVSHYIGVLSKARHWSYRADAAFRLGKTGSLQALQPLLGVLMDDEEDATQVKSAAARGLALIRDKRAIGKLIEALGIEQAHVASSVSEALKAYGDTAVEPLLRSLQTLEYTGRQLFWIIRTLGGIRDRSAVNPLLDKLSDPNPEIRIAVIKSLKDIGDTRAAPRMIDRMLHDPSPMVRTSAVQFLSGLADESALEPLLSALHDPDENIRARSVDALEMLGPVAKSALLDVLKDPRPRVRFRAASALERIGAVYQAIQELCSADPKVRENAVRTLEGIARAGILESILEGLRDRNFRVRARLCQVLAGFSDPKVAEAIEPCLKDKEWPVQTQAMLALSKLPHDINPEVFLKLAGSDIEEVRWAAVQALKSVPLEKIRDKFEKLEGLIRDENHAVRHTAVELLAMVPGSQSMLLLSERLDKDEADIRKSVCGALANFKTQNVLTVLEKGLKDKDSQVREAAARAVAGLGFEAGKSLIFSTAEKLSPDVMADCIWELFVQDVAKIGDNLMGAGFSGAKKILVKVLLRSSDPDSGPFLRALLREPDLEIVKDAIELAGKIRDEKSVDSLLHLCESPDSEVRVRVVKALGRIGSEKALPRLEMLLDKGENAEKCACLLALGRIGTLKSENLIEPYLASSLPEVRIAAVIGAGITGSSAALSAVLPHFSEPEVEKGVLDKLASEDEEIGQQFFKTFDLNIRVGAGKNGSMTRELMTGYVRDLSESLDASKRLRVVQAMGIMRLAEAEAPLRRALREDPSETVRAKALSSLVRLVSEKEGCDLLEKSFSDPSLLLRRTAVMLAGQMDRAWANSKLVSLMHSADDILAQETIDTIIKINRDTPEALVHLALAEQDPGILEKILNQLEGNRSVELTRVYSLLCQHEAADVRAVAVRRLGEIPGEHIPAALREAFSDPSPKVRLAVLENLHSRWHSSLAAEISGLCQDPVPAIREKACILKPEMENPAG